MKVGPRRSGQGALAAAAVFVAAGAYTLGRYNAIEPPAGVISLLSMAAWLAVFSLACYGPGRLIQRLAMPSVNGAGRSPAPVWDADELAIALASGAGALMAAAGALSLAGLFRPWALVTVLALSALWGGAGAWRRIAAWKEVAQREPALVERRRAAPGGGALWMLVAAAAAVTLLAAATPSAFYDQLHYHLAFPFQWLRAGSLFVYPREVFSFFPANMGLLYAYGLAAAGVWAAQGIHLWMGALAVFCTMRIARLAALDCPEATLAEASRTSVAPHAADAGRWAAALLATAPAVMMMAACASSDLGVTALGAACWLALLMGASDPAGRRTGPWILSGVFAGIAVGCKYLALASVAVPAGAALIVWTLARRGGAIGAIARAGRLAIWSGALALAFAPWAARNVFLTGNPFHPFLAGTFATVAAATEGDDGGMHGSEASAARIAKKGASRPSAGEILTLKTFAPRGEAGAIGPAWIPFAACWLLSVALLEKSRIQWMLATGFLAGVACWSFVPPLGRYLLPVLAVGASGAGASWAGLLGRCPRGVSRSLRILGGALLLWALAAGVSPAMLDQLACALGRGDHDEMMTRNASYWPAIPIVNERLPAGARVLMVAESRTLHLERDLIVEDPYRTPWILELAGRARGAGELAETLGRAGVTHILFNRHEADRIARMNGWEGYFGPPGSEARGRIEALFACLSPPLQAGPVLIYTLRPCSP